MKTASRALLPIVLALGASAALAEGPLQGNEVFNFQSQATRADVRAEAAAANRAGLIARGEAQPTQAQATVVASELTRAQVRAEAAEANRLGLIARGEILPVPTPGQLEQIRLAGLRAVQGTALVQGGEAATLR